MPPGRASPPPEVVPKSEVTGTTPRPRRGRASAELVLASPAPLRRRRGGSFPTPRDGSGGRQNAVPPVDIPHQRVLRSHRPKASSSLAIGAPTVEVKDIGSGGVRSRQIVALHLRSPANTAPKMRPRPGTKKSDLSLGESRGARYGSR